MVVRLLRAVNRLSHKLFVIMVTCYISFQKGEVVLSLKKNDEITVLKQSNGKLGKPLDIIFYNRGNMFVDCSDANTNVKKDSLDNYHLLVRSDIALSLTRYCSCRGIIEGEELSVISQTESTYELIQLGNVMNVIFNDIFKTLSDASIDPDEFFLPVSCDCSVNLYHFVHEWWLNSDLRSKKLNFILLETAIAMGFMKEQKVDLPVVVVDYDYLNAKVVCLAKDSNGLIKEKVEYLGVSLIDLYDELIKTWKKDYNLEIQDDSTTNYALYHVCNSVLTTLTRYSQAEVNLSFIQEYLRPMITKQAVVDLLKEKVETLSHEIDRFVVKYPGCKVIVNGGNCNVFTIFNTFFPHVNEWIFANHEDSMGWDGVPVINFELTKVVSMRNSSMKGSRTRECLANDSFVTFTNSFDSQSLQKSWDYPVDK